MKKVVSLLIAMMLMLQLVAVPVWAGTFTDIEDPLVEEAAEILNTLGVFNGKSAGKFAPDDVVRRGEMASIANRMLGMGDIDISAEQIFTDVTQRSAVFKDVYVAYKLGIVSGVTEDKYFPQQTVTYAQAIKMIVTVLGYEIKADTLGGYPTGYINVAAQLGLLRYIDIPDFNAGATRGDIARILLRAIDTSLFSLKGFGNDSMKFEVNEEVTVLTQYLDCSYVDGIVTATELTTLNGRAALPENQITIGDKRLNTANMSIKDYVGYKVRAYYKKEDSGRETVVSFVLKNESELVLNKSNYISAEIEGAYIRIKYVEEGKTREKKVLADKSNVVYNGKYRPMDSPTSYTNFLTRVFSDFSNGTLTLVNNGLNSPADYDFVNIKKGESFQVDRVDVLNNVLHYVRCDARVGKEKTKEFYRLSDYNDQEVETHIYNASGKEIKLEEVKENDIVTVYRALDGLYYNIFVNTSKVTGKVSSIDDTNRKLIIDGTEYSVASTVNFSLFEVDLSSDFYLDIDGNIASTEFDGIDKNSFGILLDVQVTTKGLADYPKIKVIDGNGNIKILDAENEIFAYYPVSGTVQKRPFGDFVNRDTIPKGYANDEQRHWVWYEDNAANFKFFNGAAGSSTGNELHYYRPWLTEDEKSDIASRRPVYYETNGKGRVTKIFVPDIPVNECRITSVNRVDNGTPDDRSDDTFKYSWVLRRSLGAFVQKDAKAIKRINDNALCYDILAVNYEPEDYKKVANVSKFTDGYSAPYELYEIDGSDKVDVIVRYHQLPTDGDGNIIVVDSVVEMLDGTFKLIGYSNGARYEGTITAKTRVIERRPYDVTAGAYLDATNIESYVGRTVTDFYDRSVSTTHFIPTDYINASSLKRGDVIIVGKDGGRDIVYIEMVMRADKGVILISSEGSDFSERLSREYQIEKGVVTKVEDGMYWVNLIGEYNGRLRRSYPVWPDYKFADGNLSSFYKDDQMYNLAYSGCKIWEYDVERSIATPMDETSVAVGDVVLIRGKTYNPKQCIVLKNYAIDQADGSFYKR